MSQVKKRRNRARDRVRMERFLQTKCVVCKGPGELPSRRLTCCRQFCHEDCLIQSFKYASGPMKTRCPHCKQTLVPCNSNEETPPVAPGSFLFVFQMVRYNSSLLTFDEFESDQLFLNPAPIPSPPPGWSAFRQQWRR